MPPVDPSELAQDKDFMGADPEEQAKFLSSQDQDFAKAPREDQLGYLEHLTGKPVRPNVGLAPGAPPSPQEAAKTMQGQGPVGRNVTSFGAQLSQAPAAMGKMVLAKHWPIIDSHNFHELGEDIKSLNPIVKTDTGETGGVDIGATAANLLPYAAGGMRMLRDIPVREAALGDPDVAAVKGLGVPAKSPKMQATLRDLSGARPFLKGAASLEDLQTRIPQAKAEIWDPYNKAVSMIKNRPVMGPDGPTTVGELEQMRLKNSADLQTARKVRPTDEQTAIQRERSLAQMQERDSAIKSALDPELQKAGVDPRLIREAHGNVKGIERLVSGRSTVAEAPARTGLGRMGNVRLMKPSSWLGEPLQGIRDIAAGRPMAGGVPFIGKNIAPTDLAIGEGFRTGGMKPNFGTPTVPRMAGLLPAAPQVLGPSTMTSPTSPPPITYPFRGVGRNSPLMLTPGPIRLGSPMEGIEPFSPPPAVDATTTPQRFGRMLPERATGRIPLREYGYSSPKSPGEMSPIGKFSPGKKVGEIRKFGNSDWRWDGEKWSKQP